MIFFSTRPLCLFFAVFLLGAFLLGLTGNILLSVLLGLFLASLVLLCFLRKRISSPKYFFLCFTALLLSAASILSYRLFLYLPMRGLSEKAEHQVVIGIEEAHSSQNYTRATGQLLSCNGKEIDRKVSVFLYGAHLAPGDLLSATAHLSTVCSENAKELYDSGLAATVQDVSNISITAGYSSAQTFFAGLRLDLADRIFSCVPGEAGNLYSVLFLGEKDFLSQDSQIDFQRMGISHMLAVSGMHLSVLILSLDRILRFLRLHKTPRSCINILLTLLYMGITGFSPSVCRAGIMLIIIMLGFLFNQESDGITSLFFTVSLLVILQPSTVKSLSLWLSSISTLAILLVNQWREKQPSVLAPPPNERPKIPRKHPILRWIRSNLLITLCATVATLPICALSFGETSLFVFPANLLFAIPVSLALRLSPFILLFGGSFPLLGKVAAGLGDLILAGANLFGNIPGMQVSLHDAFAKITLLSMFVVLLALVACHRRPIKPILCVVASAVMLLLISRVGILLYNGARTTVTYVGNETAGATLVISSSNRITIYDASDGTSALRKETVNALHENGATEVELYILSHLSYRSASSLRSFLASALIKEVWLPSPLTGKEEERMQEVIQVLNTFEIDYRVWQPEERFSFPHFSLQMLPSYANRSGQASYGMHLSVGASRILFMTPSYTETPFGRLGAEEALSASQFLIIGSQGPKATRSPFYLLDRPLLSKVIIGNKEKALLPASEESIHAEWLEEPPIYQFVFKH